MTRRIDFLSGLIWGLTIAAPLVAASTHQMPTTYGFFSGPNISSPSYSVSDTLQETNSRLGAQLGSYADFPLTSWLFFRPELNFVQKGYKATNGGSTQLDYIEIPLSLVPRFFFKGGSVFFPFGASYGILVRRVKSSSQGADQQIDSKHLSMNELCTHGGVGVEINFGYNWGMFFLGRYSYGISNVGRFATGGIVEDYRSRGLSALIGVFMVDRDDLDPNESRAIEYLQRHRGNTTPN